MTNYGYQRVGMSVKFEDAEKDYIHSIAKLLKGKPRRVVTQANQSVYEIGGIIGMMPVGCQLMLKPREDHYIEVYINIVSMYDHTCLYTLCSAPDFVYENLSQWIVLKEHEQGIYNRR